MVERWFREITQQRIRRGTFISVQALIAAIEEYLAEYKSRPEAVCVDEGRGHDLAKIDRCRAA